MNWSPRFSHSFDFFNSWYFLFMNAFIKCIHYYWKQFKKYLNLEEIWEFNCFLPIFFLLPTKVIKLTCGIYYKYFFEVFVNIHAHTFLVAQSLNCLQCRRPGFNPWVRKLPWTRKWQPNPVFLPGKSHGQRSLAGYSPWGPRVGHDLPTCKHMTYHTYIHKYIFV